MEKRYNEKPKAFDGQKIKEEKSSRQSRATRIDQQLPDRYLWRENNESESYQYVDVLGRLTYPH